MPPRKTVLVLQYQENASVTRTWVRGFLRFAKTANWCLQTLSYSGELKQLREIREAVRYLAPDGVVSACFTKEFVRRRLFCDIPHVWFDGPVCELPTEDSVIWHDDQYAVELVADEFLNLNLPNYAVVGDLAVRKWSSRRIRMFCQRIEAQGFKAETVELKEPSTETVCNLKQIGPWLLALPKPCGVFAVNDRIGACVITAANRLGLRIPEDLVVIGIDNDEDICLSTIPPLSSVATDWEKGGFLAGDALACVMRDPSHGPIRRPFGDLGLIRRASSAPLRTRANARVAEASAFIRAHACEGISVDDVVRHMGCSRRLALLRYQEATGHSIFSEIRDVKFAHVLVLLARRDVQIGAIANRCGWKSAMSLRTYFEGRTGMTLRAWRAAQGL